MRFIRYDAINGIPVSDGAAEAIALKLHSQGCDFIVSTDNLISATRALISEQIIPANSVSFIFNDETLTPDESGRLANWPKGFCDYLDNWLSRLTRARKIK